MIRPLDRVTSIKVKLGLAIVGSLSITLIGVVLGLRAGLRPRWTVPLGLLVSLAIVQVLSRGMTSPLREMAAAASAMSRGEYGRRVTATSRDEVGELAVAFNRMADDLAAVDEQRRRLVADVSHELRTPLTALQALLENVADGVVPADRATLETAVEQTRRLGRLVAQLLDLSRLEAGELPLHREAVRLGPFVDRVVAEAARSAAAVGRSVEVAAAVEPPDLVVDADPERLHQVLANLLDNATRHATRQVGVTASRSGATVRLAVSDDGPGIAPDQRERVFERFARADAARAASDGGSGLGLSITRELVELHGGTVVVADAAAGCTVVVSLPQRTP